MSYQVELDVFEGPFDLLLQLISRREVDITEVDLAAITKDFLASLPDIETLDLETATHFLVVASALIEIKAARLLPEDEREELEDLASEARDVLYARLLEYRAFRDAAELLGHCAELSRGFIAREVPLEPEFQKLVPEVELDTTPEELARLAALADARGEDEPFDLSHIRRTYISVQEAAERILAAVPDEGAEAIFDEVASGLERGDRVVFFLSLLELYKHGELDLQQPDPRGELRLLRRGSAHAGQVAILLDAYDGGLSDDGDDAHAARGSG